MAEALFLASYVLLWACTAFCLVGVVGLYGQAARQKTTTREGRANMGPKIGERLSPSLQLALGSVMGGSPTVGLIGFVSTSCRPCKAMLPELQAVLEQAEAACLLLCQAPSEADAHTWGQILEGRANIQFDARGQRANEAGILLTPFFLGLTPDYIVAAKGISNDREMIEQFVNDCRSFSVDALASAERSETRVYQVN